MQLRINRKMPQVFHPGITAMTLHLGMWKMPLEQLVGLARQVRVFPLDRSMTRGSIKISRMISTQ